jgi:hypothetical protein
MAITLDSTGLIYPDSSVQASAGLSHPVSIGSSFEGGYYIGSLYHLGYPYYIVLAPFSSQTQSRFTTNLSFNAGSLLSPIDGYNNTTILTSTAGQSAAQYCADLTTGGYSDWYLPSVYELLLAQYAKYLLGVYQKLYGVKYYTGTSVFNGWQYYWTSSAPKTNSPYIMYSPDGFFQGVNETFGSASAFADISFPYVRAVRRVAI